MGDSCSFEPSDSEANARLVRESNETAAAARRVRERAVLDASRLEAGGRLDALVAERVMGWPVVRYSPESGQAGYLEWHRRFKAGEQVLWLDSTGWLWRGTKDPESGEESAAHWSPSTDVRAAFEAAAKVGTDFTIQWVQDPRVLQETSHPGTGQWLAGLSRLTCMRAETAPLAVCRMAVLAESLRGAP